MAIASPALAVLLVASLLAGCASSPATAPARPSGLPLDGLHRVVVVPSGETRFASVVPSRDPDREVDEVLKFIPFKDLVAPIARAVHRGVTWLMNVERANAAPRDVTPGAVVADAFVRSLRVSGPFDEIVALDREPVGEARRNTDAIVRISVPAWGLVGVREGDAPLVATFADVRAQLVARESGVVLWEHAEDVTHPERLSIDALRKDRALSREGLIDVLERAGRRLATELLYARGRTR